jgi:hypothetical protein
MSTDRRGCCGSFSTIADRRSSSPEDWPFSKEKAPGFLGQGLDK